MTKSSSPLPGLLLLLSATTGLVDAVSVLGLGKVFTANMTGNIVFLGFAAVGTPGFAIKPYLVALLAFLIGALVAGRIGQRLGQRPLRQWLLSAAGVEGALLGLAAVCALVSAPWIDAIIALTALAMGFRNATIRMLKVPDLTTTVLTLTLTGIAADSALAGGASPNLPRRIAAVASIFAGAAAGALMVTLWGLALPLALAAGMVVLGTMICVAHPAAALVHNA
ncbi:uncharacterized membrane protein YoaK (UPF0700 family) [Novosphingobium sp. SG751A]|uniref:YoaK family protein n=1 Tax=Novosphingobium sp. SG751A TaxID=2587000 RepID=UPI0015544F08|nr:YoaK family protein [Novosphingobium sp. SG751A]NOW47415.1 uncharacterized membrane protein YoaK (UPF0700 family) [Novosphingobium sp. SG751A]